MYFQRVPVPVQYDCQCQPAGGCPQPSMVEPAGFCDWVVVFPTLPPVLPPPSPFPLPSLSRRLK